MGDAIVADVRPDPGGVAGGGPRVDAARRRSRTRARGKSRPATRSTPRPSTRPWPRSLPEDAIVVLESPSSTLALRNQLRISRPGSYYFAAGGGLGFGLAASDRRAARAAEPAGRLRARRGLGPVRDHRLLERRRLRRPGHLPGPAQRGVRDPQVVRRSRAGRAAPRGSICRSSTSPRSPRATGSRPTGRATATGSPRPWPPHSPPRSRSWSKSRSRPGWRSSRDVLAGGDLRWPCWSASWRPRPRDARRPRPRPRLPRRRRRPAAARRTGGAARRRPRPRARRRPRQVRLRRQPLPALPAGGGDGEARPPTWRRSSPSAASSGIPVTFRSGGTSLNGQGQTEGILVDVRRHFGGRSRVEEEGAALRVGTGTMLGHANKRPRPATGATSAPIRRAPTSPPSAASSPTTRAGCAAG